MNMNIQLTLSPEKYFILLSNPIDTAFFAHQQGAALPEPPPVFCLLPQFSLTLFGIIFIVSPHFMHLYLFILHLYKNIK